jgi:PilZ domain
MDARLGSGPNGALAVRPVHPTGAISGRHGYEIPRQLRQYSRTTVSWPVVVEAGKRLFLLQAVNLSARGAKVRPTERLGEGSLARLHFHPPDGSSLEVEAIVWRVDLDGLAFCFTDDNDRRVTTRLVQLAGAPPRLGTLELN